MDENKEMSRGEALRKALAYQKKNGYDRLAPRRAGGHGCLLRGL